VARKNVPSATRHAPVHAQQGKTDWCLWRVVEWLMSDDAVERAEQAVARRREQRGTSDRRQELELELRQLEAAITYNLEAARQGAIPLKILVDQNRPPQERMAKVEALLTKLTATDQNSGLPSLSLCEVRTMLERAKPEEQRRFLLSILARVEIHPHNRLCVVFRHPDLRPIRVEMPPYFSLRRGITPQPTISIEEGDDPPA